MSSPVTWATFSRSSTERRSSERRLSARVSGIVITPLYFDALLVLLIIDHYQCYWSVARSASIACRRLLGSQVARGLLTLKKAAPTLSLSFPCSFSKIASHCTGGTDH